MELHAPLEKLPRWLRVDSLGTEEGQGLSPVGHCAPLRELPRYLHVESLGTEESLGQSPVELCVPLGELGVESLSVICYQDRIQT